MDMIEPGQPSKSTKFLLKKSLVIAMITVGFASFVLMLGLFFYLQVHSPSTPSPATGQVYQLNDHGYYFYVSKTESILQDVLFFAFAIFGVGAGILNVYWKVIPDNNPPKKFY